MTEMDDRLALVWRAAMSAAYFGGTGSEAEAESAIIAYQNAPCERTRVALMGALHCSARVWENLSHLAHDAGVVARQLRLASRLVESCARWELPVEEERSTDLERQMAAMLTEEGCDD